MWEVGVGRVGESNREKWIQLQVNSNKKLLKKNYLLQNTNMIIKTVEISFKKIPLDREKD